MKTPASETYTIHLCDEKFLISNAEKFAELSRLSFYEHLVNNINFGPITMTKERFIKRVSGNIGIYAESNGQIIGFNNVRIDNNNKIAYLDIAAVLPQYKGQHIGTTLINTMVDHLKQLNFNLLMTDTSLKAPHVVNFHKSYGCKAVGMTHFNGRNYYSVILRLALNPKYEICNIKAKILFIKSCIKCKAMIKENGDKTIYAKLVDKISRKK